MAVTHWSCARQRAASASILLSYSKDIFRYISQERPFPRHISHNYDRGLILRPSTTPWPEVSRGGALARRECVYWRWPWRHQRTGGKMAGEGRVVLGPEPYPAIPRQPQHFPRPYDCTIVLCVLQIRLRSTTVITARRMSTGWGCVVWSATTSISVYRWGRHVTSPPSLTSPSLPGTREAGAVLYFSSGCLRSIGGLVPHWHDTYLLPLLAIF